MSAFAGIAMLLTVALAMIVTGLPTWLLLVGVALVFGIGGGIVGVVPWQLYGSVPSRLVGLFENDLLQALPLYVFMGALLNRLPLAEALFRTVSRTVSGRGQGAPVAALVLGSVFAPMNGSVGASVVMLGRTVAPRLRESGVSQARTAAVVAMASTLGVVIPPSLVLILLGDAMLRAHTEAVNMTGRAAQIINTQDVFRGALVPAAAVLLGTLALTAWQSRHDRAACSSEPPALAAIPGQTITAMVVLAGILALLGAVTLGYVYAVEAAAAGGMAIVIYGIVTRAITRPVLAAVVRDTINVTGALFALLVAATMFTLVLRGLGTDRLVAAWLTGVGGGTYATLGFALAALALCAFVLDAFEMIFVVIPLIVPPVLVRIADPVWVSVLVLLILQASFLVPPFGYAVLMTRNVLRLRLRASALMRALVPYLLVQLMVIVFVLAWPSILWHPGSDESAGQARHPISDDESREMMERQLAPAVSEDPAR